MYKRQLVNYVQEKLNNHWSPEQISGRLKLEFNKQIISFSTIYSWLYKGILEHCSVDLLRRKGKSLKPRETRGKFNIGKTISQRPKDVRKRLDIGPVSYTHLDVYKRQLQQKVFHKLIVH